MSVKKKSFIENNSNLRRVLFYNNIFCLQPTVDLTHLHPDSAIFQRHQPNHADQGLLEAKVLVGKVVLTDMVNQVGRDD